MAKLAQNVEVIGAGWTVRSKVIEGQYPNTDQVMPRVFGEDVSLDRELLVEMIGRATVMAKDGQHTLHVAIERTGAGSVNSRTTDVGEWEESRPLCAADGRPGTVVKFSANGDYLAALDGPECAQVRLQCSPDGKGPLMWTCKEGAEPVLSWQYVLMPMRVEGDDGAAAGMKKGGEK